MPLSTNWFKGGNGVDNHISEKDGSNALPNNGSQSAPYQTIEGRIVAGNNIIRSGVYAPAAGGTLDVGGKNLIGDSENVFIYNVSNGLNEIETTAGDCTLESLNISGVLFIFDTNNSQPKIFKKCIVKDTNTLGCFALGTDRIEGNIFINITNFQHYSTTYNNPSNFLNNNFIDSNVKGSTTDSAVFLKCYFQNVGYTKTSFISTNDSETITFQDCVFDATSTFEGVTFKDIFSTSIPANKSPDLLVPESTASTNINKGTFNYTFLNAGGQTSTIQFVNCYWIDKANPTPVFNDEAGGDYSLTLSSTPQGQSVLFNAGNIIGARPLALTLNADSAPFLTGNGATLVNITKNGSLFELTTPGEGTVTSVPLSVANISGNIVIKIPQRILLTDAIRFFGNLLPQNALTGTGEVVDRVNYPPDVRYTIRLRYWDDDETLGNEVKPAGGGWYEIEHGNIFGIEIDGFNRGNGNIDVDIPDLTPIFADKFQVEFVLRDNGN